MSKKQNKLIQEEQKILDDLIKEMDNTLLQLDKNLTYKELQAEKAKKSCLPDAYGMLVSAEHEKIVVRQKIRDIYKGKDELYETRLVLDITDENGHDCDEIKVGLHTYNDGARIFIMSWKMPLCRHYMTDNSAKEYDGIVVGKNGEKFKTHYELKLKRKVSMFFDKVKEVSHFYPSMDEEYEQIIADAFLKDLANRRSGEEFKNIVFSIQKKQGEIIETPFKQNLIVQGCAGSGKSMIMLHRLPIILYDNPNSLDRNNLYIITPSIAYIQMANNMRIDLEIEDLKMGTLEQYYDYVLKKYRCQPEIYGNIKPYIKLSAADMQYVYSDRCIKDIQNRIEETINAGVFDYRIGYELLNVIEPITSKEAVTPSERIHRESIKLQTLINENDTRLKIYHKNMYAVLDKIDELARTLETRKKAINTSLESKISFQEKRIEKKEKEISKIKDLRKHEVMHQNRLNEIREAKSMLADFKEVQEIVEIDEEYFEYLKQKAEQIREHLKLFASIKKERSQMSLKEQYKALADKAAFCNSCLEIIEEVSKIDDAYADYISNSFALENRKVKNAFKYFNDNIKEYLSLEYLQKLMKANDYYSEVAENTVQNIYLSLMKRLGQEPDDKGRLNALECSPYLYLQILYQFSGMPNGVKESLITIDEAQNIEPEELKLIKAVNNDKVIFNLFGDIKQHIEGSKGIDDWNQFSAIASFQKEYIQENYRNARQITEYCNRKFNDLHMRAINLDGSGVHDLKNKDEFEAAFIGIFKKPKNEEGSCIIVKNRKEADRLLKKAGVYQSRIHDMTKELVELQSQKWNLMTIEQVKGLEFHTVFAITGRMSKNEKYIAYTRALEELYVYGTEIELPNSSFESEVPSKTEKEVKESTSTRKKRKKRSSKDTESKETKKDIPPKGLKEFFEEKGLEVIDDRQKSGHLWVIGKKDKIDSVVNEAMEIYGATGSYGSGKTSGFKEGWFTKSKK